MPDSAPKPPLKALHPDSSLNPGKLSAIDRLSTESMLASLLSGAPNCLKTRTDGTILEGRHRIHILRKRGVGCGQSPARRHDEGTRVTKFYWVNGPWNGKLALAGRPRGGDW